MNQKGIAYLMVLILGGIIIASSIVYFSSTVIESRVSINSRMSQEVFYHAEGSIYNSLNRIRNGTITINLTNPVIHPATFTQVRNIGELRATTSFVHNETRVSGNTTSVFYYVTSKGHLFRNQQLLPRSVGTKIEVIFTQISNIFSGFEHAISAGGPMTFDGNSIVRNGGVFSNVNIYLGNEPQD
ncbi:MAG: hypothetical protein DDT41_01614 [candidate division WS2 bacterium]|nr:hypothetical protein [Candidatus Psychracetigena formicireducens]